MIVTIDGPAGAGKSTAARELAARLGFRFLDTGAMYRAVTLVCLRQGVDMHDERAVAAAARGVQIRFEGDRVLANDVDVTDSIRSPEVTHETRHVAGNNAVRTHLVDLQRQLAAGLDIVCEGRDQGTVAFPDAECKFFLTADAAQRAERRRRELADQGEEHSLDEIRKQIEARDQRDQLREFGALRAAKDALSIDTSFLTRTEMVDRLERLVRLRQGSAAP